MNWFLRLVVSYSRAKILASAVISVVLLSCSRDDIHLTADSDTCPPTSQLNPNGDSELASLMRAMFDTLSVVKAGLVSNITPIRPDGVFETIFNATPSDPAMIEGSFESMASTFMTAVDGLYSAADVREARGRFSDVVSACKACHEAQCPGPLRRIERLTITDESSRQTSMY